MASNSGYYYMDNMFQINRMNQMWRNKWICTSNVLHSIRCVQCAAIPFHFRLAAYLINMAHKSLLHKIEYVLYYYWHHLNGISVTIPHTINLVFSLFLLLSIEILCVLYASRIELQIPLYFVHKAMECTVASGAMVIILYFSFSVRAEKRVQRVCGWNAMNFNMIFIAFQWKC